MKKVSLTILLTLILTVGSFAKTASRISEIRNLGAQLGTSLKILEGNTKENRKFSYSETQNAISIVKKACELIAKEGSAEYAAFAADCTGYLSAYNLSNTLVNVACYSPKVVEPKTPAPKPKTVPKPLASVLDEPGSGFSDSNDFSYESPFQEYSDPSFGYSIGGGIIDECANARKEQAKAYTDLNTCLKGGNSGWKKIGDFLGCALGVFIGRPCKTK